MTIKICFAVGVNGEFGNKNELPWGHCKKDMKHFAEYTKGCSLVMGRNTYESLPEGGLEGRELVVVTRNEDFEGTRPKTHVFYNLEKINSMLKTCHNFAHNKTMIVIGGPSLILEALDIADEVSMTVIMQDAEIPFDRDVVLDVSEVSGKLLSQYDWVNNLQSYESISGLYLNRVTWRRKG